MKLKATARWKAVTAPVQPWIERFRGASEGVSAAAGRNTRRHRDGEPPQGWRWGAEGEP
jgi:hypothetical protein